MATYNAYTYTALVILFSCLVSISVHMEGAWGCSACLSSTGKDPEWIIARDIITLTVREVQDIKKFIDTIPRLKSLQGSDTSELLGCVGGLISNLSEMRAILTRIRHLKGPFLSMDSQTLKNKSDNTKTLSDVCSTTMKDIDDIFIVMFTRKLVDLSLLVDDVLYRVSRLEPNIRRGDIERKG